MTLVREIVHWGGAVVSLWCTAVALVALAAPATFKSDTEDISLSVGVIAWLLAAVVVNWFTWIPR